MDTLGLLLARRGSTRIPGKNWKDMCGKPLFQYTLDAMLKSSLTKIIVSSNAPEIHDAIHYDGRLIRHDRSEHLCTTSSLADLTVLEITKDGLWDAVVQAEIPNPIRQRGFIDLCLDDFFVTNPDKLMCAVERHPLHLTLEDYKWTPSWEHDKSRPTQDYKARIFSPSSSVVIQTQELCLNPSKKDIKLRVIELYGAAGIDIDTMYDWDMAEAWIEKHGPFV